MKSDFNKNKNHRRIGSMKLIDQNGKVFGVINILDLFLILLLLAAGTFAGLKFIGTDGGGNIGGGGGGDKAITYTLFNSKDRKSTRLNSSHVRISYAVFCLKKKKIIIRNSRYNVTNRQK